MDNEQRTRKENDTVFYFCNLKKVSKRLCRKSVYFESFWRMWDKVRYPAENSILISQSKIIIGEI